MVKTGKVLKIATRLYEYSGAALLREHLRKTKINAVFIWIPKAAGSSIYSILGAPPKLKKLHLVRNRFVNKGIVTFVHMDYSELVKRGYVSRRFDGSAIKFAFSRNPYDRAVSLYEYLKTQKMMKQRKVPGHESFLSFCRRLKNSGCENIGLYNVRGFSQCNPQVRWIENTRIDFLGKYESLEEDCEKILNLLELPAARLPHLNATHHADYRSYYCSESKEIVEEFYEEDFRYFGYETQNL
jgi:chondroitin 4-sulfotransferase 11